MHRLTFALSIAALWSLAATASATEPANDEADGLHRCHNREQIVSALTNGFHEEAVSIGLHHNGEMMELYASDDSGTWTLLLTRTDGISCVVATGEAFEQREIDPADTPADFRR